MILLKEIIEKSQKGDTHSFRILVEQNRQYVYHVAWRILMNQEDAKDATQDCFIRVWENLDKFDTAKKFTTWVYKIIVNLCYDQLKAKRRKNETITNHDIHSESFDVSSWDTPEQKMENLQTIENLLRFVKVLPAKQQIVYMLRDIEDKSIVEVANVLKMSVKSVKSNLYYARKNLREQFMSLGE